MAALAAPFAFGFRRSTWSLLAGGIAVVIGLYGYGFWHLSHGAGPAPQLVVRVVQPYVPQEAKYDVNKFVDIVRRYLRLTAQPTASGRPADIVIWPEGAIPDYANDALDPRSPLYPAIVRSLQPGQILLMGIARIDERAVKPTYYNSLFALRRDGADLKVLGIYDKYRLVPFGEFMPASKLMSAIGFKKLVHMAEDGFSSGPPPQQMPIEGYGLVQPLICYESLFPGFRAWRRREVRRAPGVDRQCLQRRLVWPNLRAVAAPEPGQLPRHRGGHSYGPQHADGRVGGDRRPRPAARDHRPRQIRRDRRAPAGRTPAPDRLRALRRGPLLDHDRPVGGRLDSSGPHRVCPALK
jgi:hypothetical protein